MRSISTKLILAFLSIGIISVAIIFATARWNTRAEFISFLTDQTDTDTVTELSDYHLTNGSWVGVEDAIYQRPHQYGPAPSNGRPHRPYILTDEKGFVLTEGGGY